MGAGCYDLTGAKDAKGPTLRRKSKWERKGRPLSAGTVYVDPDTGALRFLVAGCDNVIAHYGAPGARLSAH